VLNFSIEIASIALPVRKEHQPGEIHASSTTIAGELHVYHFETGAGSMSLTDLASIAIIVQGMFFIASIGLVWYQLRENTRLVRAANTQKLVELSTPFYLQLAQDRALTDLWRQATRRFDELDEIDQARYFNFLTWWLMVHENIYHQWRSKLIDEDTYSSWTRDLEYFARSQQLANHWPRLNSYFESSFAEHVTAIIVRQTKEGE